SVVTVARPVMQPRTAASEYMRFFTNVFQLATSGPFRGRRDVDMYLEWLEIVPEIHVFRRFDRPGLVEHLERPAGESVDTERDSRRLIARIARDRVERAVQAASARAHRGVPRHRHVAVLAGEHRGEGANLGDRPCELRLD